jgi:hypothetical protein
MASAQKAIWFQTSKEQLDALLLEACEELQLTPTRYTLAVERYGVVNQLLERAGSPFKFFHLAFFRKALWLWGQLVSRLKVLTIWTSYCKSMLLTGGGTHWPGSTLCMSFCAETKPTRR